MKILSVEERSSFIGFLKGLLFATFFYGFSLNSSILNVLFGVPFTQSTASIVLDVIFIFLAVLSLCPPQKYNKVLKQEDVDLNSRIMFTSLIQGFLFMSMAFFSLVVLPINWVESLKTADNHIVWITSVGVNEILIIGLIALQLTLIHVLNKNTKIFISQ